LVLLLQALLELSPQKISWQQRRFHINLPVIVFFVWRFQGNIKDEKHPDFSEASPSTPSAPVFQFIYSLTFTKIHISSQYV